MLVLSSRLRHAACDVQGDHGKVPAPSRRDPVRGRPRGAQGVFRSGLWERQLVCLRHQSSRVLRSSRYPRRKDYGCRARFPQLPGRGRRPCSHASRVRTPLLLTACSSRIDAQKSRSETCLRIVGKGVPRPSILYVRAQQSLDQERSRRYQSRHAALLW